MVAQKLGPLPLIGETQIEFQASGFYLAHPWLCQNLKSEWGNERSWSLCLPFYLPTSKMKLLISFYFTKEVQALIQKLRPPRKFLLLPVQNVLPLETLIQSLPRSPEKVCCEKSYT